MIATFWDKLFEYAVKVKKEYGIDSPEYATTHEIEDILQEAFDECNRIKDVEALDVKPKDKLEGLIFEKLPEVTICEDKDGYYYMLDNQHFETPSEVLDYIIKDRRHKYRQMNAKYNNRFKQACAQMVKELYNDTKQKFMESLGYSEGQYLKNSSVVIRDAKGSEEA